MLIYRITFGGMTNESNNINNGENNSDDEPTVVTRSSSSALSFRVPVHRIRKLSFPLLLMTPPSVRTVEYRGRWRVKNRYYFNN